MIRFFEILYTIRLCNTSFISIEGVTLTNNNNGIIVDRSSYCEIRTTVIKEFNVSGIYVCNSSDNIFEANSIRSHGDVYGIWLYNSNVTFVKNNTIDVDSYSYYFDNSYDNLINITSGSIALPSNITIFDNGNAYKLYIEPKSHYMFGYANLFTRELKEFDNLWMCS